MLCYGHTIRIMVKRIRLCIQAVEMCSLYQVAGNTDMVTQEELRVEVAEVAWVSVPDASLLRCCRHGLFKDDPQILLQCYKNIINWKFRGKKYIF